MQEYVCMGSRFSRVQLLVTAWTVARQVPLSVGFSRQEYCSGLPFPPPGDLPNWGTKPQSLISPALAGRCFTASITWEAPATTEATTMRNLQLESSPRLTQLEESPRSSEEPAQPEKKNCWNSETWEEIITIGVQQQPPDLCTQTPSITQEHWEPRISGFYWLQPHSDKRGKTKVWAAVKVLCNL